MVETSRPQLHSHARALPSHPLPVPPHPPLLYQNYIQFSVPRRCCELYLFLFLEPFPSILSFPTFVIYFPIRKVPQDILPYPLNKASSWTLEETNNGKWEIIGLIFVIMFPLRPVVGHGHVACSSGLQPHLLCQKDSLNVYTWTLRWYMCSLALNSWRQRGQQPAQRSQGGGQRRNNNSGGNPNSNGNVWQGPNQQQQQHQHQQQQQQQAAQAYIDAHVPVRGFNGKEVEDFLFRGTCKTVILNRVSAYRRWRKGITIIG